MHASRQVYSRGGSCDSDDNGRADAAGDSDGHGHITAAAAYNDVDG